MRHWAKACLWISLVGFTGCLGQSEVVPSEKVVSSFSVPVALLDQTWIAHSLKEGVLPPYFKDKGWVALIGKRDLKTAVERLGKAGGMGGARAHAEASNMYRQAALIAAESLIQTYAETPVSTDPKEVAHLLTIAYSVRGDLDKARAQSSKMTGITGPVAQWHKPWADWLSAKSAWPPNLSTLPFELPPPTPGTWPTDAAGVDYQIVEQVEGASSISVDDPSTLVALALWHDAVALAIAGDQADRVSLFGARYRLPVESPVKSSAALPFEFLLGADYLMASDANYLAERFAGAKTTVSAESSLLAYVVEHAKTKGALDREKALDYAAEVRKQVLALQAAANGGTLDGTHRMFAKLAEVGLLRNLALVAELDGDRETSGVLRINAMEKSAEAFTACPVASLSLSAWDVSNRYTLRPTDKLHSLIRRYPSLETTRFSLEVLAIRDSRRAPGGIPGN